MQTLSKNSWMSGAICPNSSERWGHEKTPKKTQQLSGHARIGPEDWQLHALFVFVHLYFPVTRKRRLRYFWTNPHSLWSSDFQVFLLILDFFPALICCLFKLHSQQAKMNVVKLLTQGRNNSTLRE